MANKSNNWGLSSQQHKAIECRTGPLLILAGPGTGKTRVILAKIDDLLSSGISPHEILAMTFSRKAVEEMEDRLSQQIPEAVGRVEICTIHSFCVELVQRYAFRLGFGRRTQLLSEAGSFLLFRQLVHKTPASQLSKGILSDQFLRELLAFFQECKDNGIWPEELVEYAHALPEESDDEIGQKSEWVKITETYQIFQSHCFERGLLDFGDALMTAVRLLEDHPLIREQVQNEYQAILVDEFQDTSWIQIKLLKLLAKPSTHVAVVGDDDQAIYRFRGASFAAFRFFSESFPGHETVALTETFRLPPAVAQAATQLISKNGSQRFVPDKKLESKSSISSKVQILQYASFEDEAAETAKSIQKLLEAGVSPSEIAVLARSHSHLESFVEYGTSLGLPLAKSSVRSLYQAPVLQDLLALLRIIYDPMDSVSYLRFLTTPWMNLKADELFKLMENVRFRDEQIFSLIQRLHEVTASELKISETLHQQLRDFHQLLVELRSQSARISTSELLFEIYEKKQLIEKIKKLPEDEIELLKIFHQMVSDWELLQDRREFRSLFPVLEDSFEQNIRLAEETAPAESQNQIRLLTVHASKGLEFKYVFILSLVGRRFPSNFNRKSVEIPKAFRHEEAPNKEAHEAEERRLLYVGMTRAKEQLVLSCIEKKGTKPSLFLAQDLKDCPSVEWNKIDATQEKWLLQKPKRLWDEWKQSKARKGSPLHLSYTQLKDYDDCPQRYWFKYDLRIPLPPVARMSFGSAVHEALEIFYKKLLSVQDAKDLDIPSKEDLLTYFDTSFKNFKASDPDLTGEHYEKGREALASYYDLEYPKIKKPVAVEEKFKLTLGEHTLTGKIDRVDPDGDGVRIIDYKTGRSKTNENEDHKKEADESLQFSIYALAAKEFFGWKVNDLSFYFLMDHSELSTTRTSEQIEATKLKIMGLAESISRREFNPKPGFACQWCDFRNLCPDRA